MDQRQKTFHTPSKSKNQIRTFTNLDGDFTDGNFINRDSFDYCNSQKQLNQSHDLLQRQRSRRISYSPNTVNFQRQISKNKSKNKSKMRRSKYDSGESKNEKFIPNDKNEDSQKQTIKLCYDKLSRYEDLVSLTQQQNQNLKQQNQFLLQKLRKMQQRQQKIKRLFKKAKDYKSKWLQINNQIQITKQQTHIYRSLLHDFKEIAMIDIPVLKNKVKQTKLMTQYQQNQDIVWKNKRITAKQFNQKQQVIKKNKVGKNLTPYECIYQQSDEADQKTFGSVITLNKQPKQQQQPQQDQHQEDKYKTWG